MLADLMMQKSEWEVQPPHAPRRLAPIPEWTRIPAAQPTHAPPSLLLFRAEPTQFAPWRRPSHAPRCAQPFLAMTAGGHLPLPAAAREDARPLPRRRQAAAGDDAPSLPPLPPSLPCLALAFALDLHACASRLAAPLAHASLTVVCPLPLLLLPRCSCCAAPAASPRAPSTSSKQRRARRTPRHALAAARTCVTPALPEESLHHPRASRGGPATTWRIAHSPRLSTHHPPPTLPCPKPTASNRRAATEPGYRVCQGLLARYLNDPRAALKALNMARRDPEWGEQAVTVRAPATHATTPPRQPRHHATAPPRHYATAPPRHHASSFSPLTNFIQSPCPGPG